jgi:hypothetical protein
MGKACVVLECGYFPVQLAYPAMNVRVTIPNSPNVTLVDTVVGNVEPDDRYKQTNVSLGEMFANEIVLALKDLLNLIKGLE